MKSMPLIIGLVLTLLLTGCEKQPDSQAIAPTGTNAAPQIFETRGVVRSVPAGGHSLVVRHEEIPGYMPKMTMELTVRNPDEIAGLERNEGESELSYQMRNWYFFTWLSGDHILEQHVHNLDVAHWIMGSMPVKPALAAISIMWSSLLS